jgi:hypothetical protein
VDLAELQACTAHLKQVGAVVVGRIGWLTRQQTPGYTPDYILLYPGHIRGRYKYGIRLQVPARADDGREPVQVLI